MATRRRLLATVVAKGDYRQSLEALRDHLAGMLDAGDGNAATAKAVDRGVEAAGGPADGQGAHDRR